VNANVLDELAGRGSFHPDRLRSDGLYRPEALHRLVASSRRPGATQDALLGRVITVELCLQATGTGIA